MSTISSMGYREVPIEKGILDHQSKSGKPMISGQDMPATMFQKKRLTQLVPDRKSNASNLMREASLSYSNRFFDTFTKFQRINKNLELQTQSPFLSGRIGKSIAGPSGYNSTMITTHHSREDSVRQSYSPQISPRNAETDRYRGTGTMNLSPRDGNLPSDRSVAFRESNNIPKLSLK